jgi:predicted nucleic acid-binding protein
MTVVIDASVAVAGLVPGSAHSDWAREVLGNDDLVGPELLAIEVFHILRKAVLRGDLSAQVGEEIAHDLGDLVDYFLPTSSLGTRMWELHTNVTSYDASYVALAEALGAPLATLDRRVATAQGPRCDFLVPWERGASATAS